MEVHSIRHVCHVTINNNNNNIPLQTEEEHEEAEEAPQGPDEQLHAAQEGSGGAGSRCKDSGTRPPRSERCELLLGSSC